MQAAPSGQAPQFAEGRTDTRHAVRDIDFRRGRGGEGRIIVDLSDTSTGIDIRQQGQNIVVEFLKTALPDNLPQRFTYRYDVVFAAVNDAFTGLAAGAARFARLRLATGTPARSRMRLVKYLSDAKVEAVALFCGYHEHRPAPK